jgi:polysaccharide export outer membrane protein
MRAQSPLAAMGRRTRSILLGSVAMLATAAAVSGHGRPTDSQKIAVPGATQPRAAGRPVAAVTPSPEYVIGPNDTLSILFWRDKDMSADVVVRPDGNITLPLLNDIQAAGLTPDQLRDRILTEARRFIEDPSPTVVVKEINSRKVFITGQVEKPGPYTISSPMTVLQLIAISGGLKEFADGKNILVMRTDNGRQVAYRFDYRELLKGKNLLQNIELKPGDTVVVP